MRTHSESQNRGTKPKRKQKTPKQNKTKQSKANQNKLHSVFLNKTRKNGMVSGLCNPSVGGWGVHTNDDTV